MFKQIVMEKKICGAVIESKYDGCTYLFSIKSGGDTVYYVDNCKVVPTISEEMSEGCVCYSGNVKIESEGVVLDKAAVLWVYPNSSCVLVYNE